MKILITGGLGHIGSYLLENINKIKFIKKVYVIDNFYTNKYNTLFNLPKNRKKIYFYQIDLSKSNSLNNFKKVDIVINLAATTDAEKSLKMKKETYKNNLGIFNNVLKYCKKNSSNLLHISSTSVYGEQKGIVEENCKKLNPKSPYAEVKIKEENILKKNKNKVNFVTYRFGTISGISKGMRFHTAINKFCLRAALGQPLPIWKTMMFKPRPYLSLKDAFKVFKFTVEEKFFKNKTYNILSENLTLNQIILYFKRYKKKIRIKYEKSKLINQYSYKVSKNKFTKAGLSLNSKIHLDIKNTLRLFKNINQ